MAEKELTEAKRARNFIWAAAENYGIEPLFLAFTPDGTADMYLNLIIGLMYKWYDREKIDRFFNQLGGKDGELYEGLLWIGLEHALYQKERKTRSALEDLRREYAEENLSRYRKYKEYSVIEQIRNGHCREILGEDSGLNADDEEVLHAFSYTGEMTTDQIIEQTRQNLWKYFSYRPTVAVNKKGVYFLQKVVGAFHSVGKVSSGYVRAKNYEDADLSADGTNAANDRARHYLLQFSVRQDPEAAKRYVEACFGKSIYSGRQQEQIEQNVCTGNHKNCHLLFTRGIQGTVRGTLKDKKADAREPVKGRELREIREFNEACEQQCEKNRRHFEQNRALYQNSIRKLTERMRICLEEREEAFARTAIHGTLHPSKVWKAVYLDDPGIFERREETDSPGFSVDILMDASSSRKQMQEQIAAQAYVLAKSLGQCGIPVQICSYCSVRGYTVMRIFKSYEEEHGETELFRYVAAGNNRDGLALRAAEVLMERSDQSQKILLVLTDASPQDDRNVGEGAFYRDKEYTDLTAVQDTIREVRRLRHHGVRVIGIFMGSTRAGETAVQIFGRELVKIRNIGEFAEAVGRVLQEEINTGKP